MSASVEVPSIPCEHSCEHVDFTAVVNVQRLTGTHGGIDGYLAEVRISCAACAVQFKFLGLDSGLDLIGATCSVNREEARLAISPDGTPGTSTFRGFRVTKTQ